MIAPERLKLTMTVMSIGVATVAAGGFQQANSLSNTSLSVWTGGPARGGAVAGSRVIGWLGCGVVGRLGDGACPRASKVNAVRSSATDIWRIEAFLLAAIARSLFAAISCRMRPGP